MPNSTQLSAYMYEKQPLILIVDDDMLNRELLETIVERLGYHSMIACDGYEALAKLTPDIDLILMDVNMPGMTGLQAVTKIRQDALYADLPIIMVTALNGKQDRLDAVIAGANDYISKPLDINEVKVRTASLLKMKRAQDAVKRYQTDLEDMVAARTQSLTEALEQMASLVTTDPLTGLPNHRALIASVDKEMERALRYGRSCALLFLDIDHFKALNDGCGHAVGDAALREFGDLVRSCLRGIDTLGRWGGEEFLCLLPEADEETAQAAAERICQTVAAHIFAAAGGSHITCSVGLSLFPMNASDRSTFVAAADQAMYAAKHLGRNQVRLASDPAVAAMHAQSDTYASREETATQGMVEALTYLVESRDQYTGEHTDDVAALATQLARSMGLSEAEARMVGMVGKLHDVGKVSVTDAVLNKPGQLNEDEWEIMRRHPVIGADVVSCMPALRVVVPAIRGHHERWDGGGYPDGLQGEEIPLAARIVAVADAFGAMTTNRPYRKSQGAEWAIQELRRYAGTQFDPTVVAALEQLLTQDERLQRQRAA